MQFEGYGNGQYGKGYPQQYDVETKYNFGAGSEY
jgi:hypothetical protein